MIRGAPADVDGQRRPAGEHVVGEVLGNPVVTGTACTGPSEAVHPSIVNEGSGNYNMYYAGRSTGDRPYLAVSSDAGLTWTCGNSGNALLPLGGTGTWDANRIAYVSVLKEGATDYKMWYSGRDATYDGNWAIGYATSSDGVSWTKDGSNPVLTGGSFGAWDSHMVREPSVVNVGGTYHMWYTGVSNWPYFHIGHATSSDGITWTKDAATRSSPGRPAAGMRTSSIRHQWSTTPSILTTRCSIQARTAIAGLPAMLRRLAPMDRGRRTLMRSSPHPALAGKPADSQDYAGAVLDGATWKVFYSQGGTYQIGLATLTNQAQLTFNPSATQRGRSAATS